MRSFKIRYIHLLLFILFSACLQGQSFNYKQVTDVPTFVKKYNETKEYKKIIKSDNYIDAVKYLPQNHVKNATVDYTSFLQRAIDENKNILMPNFPILINDKGLDIKSNRKILFRKNSRLILSPSNKANYEIMRIHNRDNVHVFSPKITGDRYIHQGTGGEWGMGISIKSSSNISIINGDIIQCWGDGIYLGSTGGKTNSNILIDYGRIDENRRNGISVITANGLLISNIIVSNTYGTNPQAGIDFEPNNNKEVLKKIHLENIYTYNNFHQGIFYCFNQLNGSTESINITLKKHTDRESKVAIGLMNLVSKKQISSKPISGNLKLIDIEGTNIGFRVFDNSNINKLNVIIERNNTKKNNFKTQGNLTNITIK